MDYLSNEFTDSPEAPPVAAASHEHVAAISPTDGERLMRFVRRRDEAAFRELVETHAAMVWGVCWQLLRHREDIEDAFQATFLILARKARSIEAYDSVAGWLYRVAFRTANLARQRRQRRGCEPIVEEPGSLDEQLAAIERAEQCQVLLDELNSLAVRYREPIVLCYLEGCTRSQAADQLGVTAAAVKGLLARGLRLLRRRLAQRGAALSTAAAALAVELATAQAANDSLTIAQTAAAGCGLFGLTSATGTAVGAPSAAAPGAISLAQKGIMAMTFAAAAKPAIGLLAVGMTAGVLALATAAPLSTGNDSGTTIIELAATDAPSSAPLAAPAAEPEQILAAVSGEAPAGQLSVATTAPVAVNAAAAADPTSTPAGAPSAGVTTITAALATPPATTPSPARMATGTFSGLRLPTPAGTVSVDSGTLPATAPTGTLTLQSANVDPPAAGVTPVIVPPQTANSSHYINLVQTTAPSSASSRAAIEIELQYWTLKASGLSKKAEALKLKAQSIDVSSDSERVLVLEIESEADLTLAEVKHCEAMTQQLKDDLSRPSEPVPTYNAPVPGIPGGAPPMAVPPTGAAPTPPLPAVASMPAEPLVARSLDPLTPQNTLVQPVNPPTGPGITSAYPPIAGMAPAAQQQVEALSNEVEALRALSQRLQHRIDELEKPKPLQ